MFVNTTLLGVALTILAAVLPPGGSFVDDDASVHEGAIEAVAAIGVTRGCDPPANLHFCPEEEVTRGQMAAFLTRALRLRTVNHDRFVDDEGHTFEADIDALAAAGITRGCNPPASDRFCPDDAVSRGEMAAMLVRAFHLPVSSQDMFGDDDGHLFEPDIDTLAAAGVTRGCNPPDNHRFCPDESVTREQMASFLARALDLEPIFPPDRPHPPVLVTAREAWGARPAEIAGMTPHIITRLTVHHAGTQTGTTGPAQFRGWQDWHMTGQGWPDLAYHVIVGIDGTVYEGRDPRFQGDTGTPYDTSGHFLVVVEGNFDHEQPTPAQLDSLTRVLAWAAAHYDVPPATISGHRDHAATSCPGENLAALIDSGELQSRVRDVLSTGGVELVWP